MSVYVWEHDLNGIEHWSMRGYVESDRRTHATSNGLQVLVTFVDPKVTCCRVMRDGCCTMRLGHRGRCTTVSFSCDGCGMTRRGSPHYSDPDGPSLCFMCAGRPSRERRF